MNPSGSQAIINSGHIYTFEGRQYPSVTTVLSRTEDMENRNRLRNWRANFRMEGFRDAYDYTEYTSVRGTFVHFNVLNSMAFTPLDPEGLPAASKWMHRVEMLQKDVFAARSLWENSGIEVKNPMEMEQSYYHPELGYAGQLDFRGLVRLPGEDEFLKTIMDLKTSKQINDKHRIQVGAYTQMYNLWNRDDPAVRGLVVSLHPAAKRAIICNINRKELDFEITAFNEHLEKFWNIPGIKGEYGLT